MTLAGWEMNAQPADRVQGGRVTLKHILKNWKDVKKEIVEMAGGAAVFATSLYITGVYGYKCLGMWGALHPATKFSCVILAISGVVAAGIGWNVYKTGKSAAGISLTIKSINENTECIKDSVGLMKGILHRINSSFKKNDLH
jgi:hypothetical protein